MKLNDRFYFVDSNFRIKSYRYLMEIPYNSEELKGRYHVLQDNSSQEVFRVSTEFLKNIISQNLNSYEEAQVYKRDRMLEAVEDIFK